MADTPTPPDADWQALRRGERAALERLYRAHAGDLLRYGRAYAGDEAVADALQDLFVRLWERRGVLTESVAVRPYLLIALRNDLLRRNKRAARFVGEREAALPDEGAKSVEDGLVDAERAGEQSRDLAAALATLSERERELVDLRFRQNLDYEAIVEVTGISYQSARNTLARAIKKLRGRLATTLFCLALGTSVALSTPLSEHVYSLLP